MKTFKPPQSKTIHKVLICTEGAEDSLIRKSYFDNIITFEELIDERNW